MNRIFAYAAFYALGALCLTNLANAESAADAYYDPAAMAKARAALKAGHGRQINSLIMAERLEYQSNDGDPLAVWEAQGWIGGDIQKLWLKTEGEYESSAGQFEEAEVQALYSRAISPFWELQTGLRHDAKPSPTRTYAVVGLQGLAPYWFELDSALFLSDKGDLSARFEAEYELRFTQRLLLQPRLELNLAFSEDADIGQGSGLTTADLGLRLRYEFRRELAPYIGVSWSQSFGSTKDFKRAEGEQANQLSLIAGIRLWF